MLTFRRIDPDQHFAVAEANKRDACIASFGTSRSFTGGKSYRRFLREKTEEFPDGFVLVYDGDHLIGQLEMQVPFGLDVGYVWLFYVAPSYRGRGYGRLMQRYVERYFRAWEAHRIELHVSATNLRARRFYRALGYRPVEDRDRDPDEPQSLKMVKDLAPLPGPQAAS